MVVKSILITVIGLLIYSYFINIHANYFAKGQHQWQDNIICAQNYLYSSQTPDKVVIGSSMACRLVDSCLPKDLYKLTFGGQGIFDGLNIIQQKSKLPAQLFIEMNMVERGASTDFANSVFSPCLFFLRKKLPIFREQYQPLNLLSGHFQEQVGIKLITPFTNHYFHPVVKRIACFFNNDTATSALTVRLANRQTNEYNTPYPSKLIQERFKTLQQIVQQLKSKGVQCVFFEMPMNSAIENSIRLRTLRQMYEWYLPKKEYIYLPKPNYADYKTIDGVHLNGNEAVKYTLFFIYQSSRF